MNGNKTLQELEKTGCAYGVASRAVQDERDWNIKEKIDIMERAIATRFDKLDAKINKILLAMLPTVLTIIIIFIYMLTLVQKV